jgi:hypothetical protein
MRYHRRVQYTVPAFLLQRQRFGQRLKRIFDRHAAAATRFASFAIWLCRWLHMERATG